MKIIHINTTSEKGSTGVIVKNIHNELKKQGNNSRIICSHGELKDDSVLFIQSRINYFLNNIISRVFGIEGLTNYFSTKKMLKVLKKNVPDIIHLHNLHGHYIHIGLLFKFIKKHKIPVVWTLHDCWAFTGGCAYFDSVSCDKWKMKCGNCNLGNKYPKWIIDNTNLMLRYKKKHITSVDNMTVVTPSKWLADLAKQSFLNKYIIKVVNNGINIDVFKRQ